MICFMAHKGYYFCLKGSQQISLAGFISVPFKDVLDILVYIPHREAGRAMLPVKLWHIMSDVLLCHHVMSMLITE